MAGLGWNTTLRGVGSTNAAFCWSRLKSQSQGGTPGRAQQEHPHRLQSTEPAVTAPSLGWHRRPIFVLLCGAGGRGVQGKHRVWSSAGSPGLSLSVSCFARPPTTSLTLLLLLDDGGVRPFLFFLLFLPSPQSPLPSIPSCFVRLPEPTVKELFAAIARPASNAVTSAPYRVVVSCYAMAGGDCRVRRIC